MFPHHRHHWAYIWVPFLGALVWFSTLWAMLIVWLAQGRPRYVSEEGTIAYISDIGADILKPLFIAGGSVTAVCFFLSLVIERWLRHSGRLLPTMRRREFILSCMAIFGSFIGGCGLILLTVFDTKRFESEHRAFLLLFMIGVALSAIFTIIEYFWLSRDFPYAHKLQYAYIAKGLIALILVVLSIAFGVELWKNPDAGAVLEWVIAFGFTFFLLTFIYDLRQSKGRHRGELSKERMRGPQGADIYMRKV